MSALTLVEKVELGALPVCMALGGWLTPGSGLTLDVGETVAAGALLLLIQGFFRDLYLLWESKQAKPDAPAISARCLCVESAIGLTGVIAGVGLTAIRISRSVHLEATSVMLSVGAVLMIGFLLKDFVFEWAPWKIFREKNHAQVIFRWKK
jgi:hypothetical protein